MAGVKSGSLSTYLQKLRRLRLVERHIPVTESLTSSKRGRYRIAAPLFRFWFRFVYGNQDQLRMVGESAYEDLVAPELADYVSPLFERLCQRALPTLVDRQFRDVGQWWFKEHELAVLGLTAEGLVAGECKFTSNPVSEGILSDLERTVAEVRWSKRPADEGSCTCCSVVRDTLQILNTSLKHGRTSVSSTYPTWSLLSPTVVEVVKTVVQKSSHREW